MRLIIILFSFFPSVVLGQDYSASEILNKIEKEGAKSIVQEYYLDHYVQADFLQHIVDGDAKWVEIGVKLLRKTDASYTSNTYSALAWHLWRNPKNVLPYINVKIHDGACDPGLYEGQDVTPYYLAMESAIIRLKAVTDENILKQRDLCLEKLVKMSLNWEESLNKGSNNDK